MLSNYFFLFATVESIFRYAVRSQLVARSEMLYVLVGHFIHSESNLNHSHMAAFYIVISQIQNHCRHLLWLFGGGVRRGVLHAGDMF